MVDETNGQGTQDSEASTSTSTGPSLESFIASNGPMTWKKCLSQFHDICFNLERNQAQPTAYGKLNIRSFTITDGGTTGDITYNPGGQNTHSVIFPDEAYFSPEQSLEKGVDTRSDIYSLGCVLYHCLTGTPPFMHSDKDKLKEMHAIDYPLPPGRRSQKHYIPDEVDLLVNTCLEKDPARRFQDAGELRANIGKAMQLDEDVEEPKDRVRLRNVLVGVAAIVAALGAFAYLSLWTTSSHDFVDLIKQTSDRHRNRYAIDLEAGPQFMAQMEFNTGALVPDKKPLELKVNGEDVVLFATTKRDNVKDAVQEAIRRKITLYRVDLKGQDLQGLIVPGGNLFKAVASNAKLDKSQLSTCVLNDVDFTNASLTWADIKRASANHANFQGANLEHADFSSAQLIDANLADANLKQANFTNALLVNTDLKGADVTGAFFKDAKMTSNTANDSKLSKEQLAQVQIVKDPREGQPISPSNPTEPTGMMLNPPTAPGTQPTGLIPPVTPQTTAPGVVPEQAPSK